MIRQNILKETQKSGFTSIMIQQFILGQAQVRLFLEKVEK